MREKTLHSGAKKRAGWLVFVLLMPQSAIAAERAISCELTKEDMFYVTKNSPDGTSAQRDINRTAHFTLTESSLLTPMAAPCDRLSRTGADAEIDAACQLRADNNSSASIRIQIDSRTGAIKETWDILESDGSKLLTSTVGICLNWSSS